MDVASLTRLKSYRRLLVLTELSATDSRACTLSSANEQGTYNRCIWRKSPLIDCSVFSS